VGKRCEARRVFAVDSRATLSSGIAQNVLSVYLLRLETRRLNVLSARPNPSKLLHVNCSDTSLRVSAREYQEFRGRCEALTADLTQPQPHNRTVVGGLAVPPPICRMIPRLVAAGRL
jgi:hypothetical protein